MMWVPYTLRGSGELGSWPTGYVVSVGVYYVSWVRVGVKKLKKPTAHFKLLRQADLG